MARVTILQYSEHFDRKRGVRFLPTRVLRDGHRVILGVAEDVPDAIAREYLAQPGMFVVDGLTPEAATSASDDASHPASSPAPSDAPASEGGAPEGGNAPAPDAAAPKPAKKGKAAK